MAWNLTDIVGNFGLNIVGGFLAGVALLICQWLWNRYAKWRSRKAAIGELRQFFRDWEAEVSNWLHDDFWVFTRHEQMIKRFWINHSLLGPRLLDWQSAALVELVADHEMEIHNRWKALTPIAEEFRVQNDRRHYALLPDDYPEFFSQVALIEWLHFVSRFSVKESADWS